MIFSGNLRLNLDPFESHTDEELWKILELSHLKNFVSGLEEGLLYPISEEGGNLRYVLASLSRNAHKKNKQSMDITIRKMIEFIDLDQIY